MEEQKPVAPSTLVKPVPAAVTVVSAKKEAKGVDVGVVFGNLIHKIFGNAFLHVPLQDRVLFARHLSVGIKAGMSMQDSLKLIQAQSKAKSFKAILDVLISDTANGMFLSASMEKYESVFGQLFINIIRVGEQSGTLTENLSYLGRELKKKQELRSKVRGALIYPAVIFVATIGIVSTLMIAVFPKILPVFGSLRIKLPLSTRILIALTNFMTQYTFWLIFGVFALVILVMVLSRHEWFKNRWHAVLLRLPVVGKIAVKINMASVSRILGLLLKSGTQIIEAVNITADALDNRVYRRELRTAGEQLRRGEFFSIYLSKNPRMFPLIFTNMVQVGENTGNLTENLDYLSGFYEEDVDEVLKNLNSIIEPFLLLFMGLLVGFMALSVVTPIYSISQSLGH
jgi:type IV pilus assembly protein PilC